MITKKLPYYGSRDQLINKGSLPDPKHPDEIRAENGYPPSPLSPICMKLLEKDPKNRYQNASELLCALPTI